MSIPCDGSGAITISDDDWIECPVCQGSGCPQPQNEPEPVPHKWDEDGERCEACGDKDWMADASCSRRLIDRSDK